MRSFWVIMLAICLSGCAIPLRIITTEAMSEKSILTKEQETLKEFTQDEQWIILAFSQCGGDFNVIVIAFRDFKKSGKSITFDSMAEYIFEENERLYREGHVVYTASAIKEKIEQVRVKYRILSGK